MNISKQNYPISSNISKIIKEKGLKQCAVADKAGYKIQDFNGMLNGRRLIKSCDVLPIAMALGIDPNELFKEK